MSEQYEYEIDPSGNSTANKVLRAVGVGVEVLELGTAAGVMTRALKAQGCKVTGVEYVPEMAERAANWCERMIVGDLEQLDIAEAFAGTAFDVVVAADVLEHLRDPWQVLARLRSELPGSPRLVVSVPNVAHAGLVAALGRGRFDYREKGLLDRTHMRFFTRASLEWMLLETGWLPVKWDANRVAVEVSEFGGDWSCLSPSLQREYLERPDADVYQYIVTAEPASDAGFARRQMAELDALRVELRGVRAELDLAVQRHAGELADLLEHRKAYAEARGIIEQQHQQMQTMDAEMAVLRQPAPKPAWMNHGDRRILCVLARVLHRIAYRLGG